MAIRLQFRIRPSQWYAVRKQYHSRITSALQWLVERGLYNGVHTYSLLRLESFGSTLQSPRTSWSLRLPWWTWRSQLKFSEYETVKLPALYIHANSQMLRHKLITQPSNLFLSCIVCLINILKKTNLKAPFFHASNALKLIICHSQILIWMNYFIQKCTAFLPSNYYFEDEWRLGKLKGDRAWNIKGF